jgi:6-phosphogluconolactonase
MRVNRRSFFKTAAAGVAASSVAGTSRADSGPDARAGRIFTSTNAANGNEVLVFDATLSGALRLRQRVVTGGNGTGSGLGSQGAVTLSRSGRFLFVVNAGSNSLSAFRVGAGGLRLTSVVPSGGLGPTSVAEDGGLVFVLNAQGAGGVMGFGNLRGRLLPIADSARGLSASGGTAPAQVGFAEDGETLVVSERATYRVHEDGSLGMPQANTSAGPTPFGFVLDRRGTLLVSEAAGGAANASTLSSYRFADGAPQTPVVVSASVPTQQSAACWVVATPDGRFAYTTNTGSGSVSLFRVGASGGVTLLQSAAAVRAGTAPIDASVSSDGHRLYVLDGAGHAVATYAVVQEGTLELLSTTGVLPAGTVGLAAD